MYRNKQLTREQAQQEYQNYCNIQPQGEGIPGVLDLPCLSLTQEEYDTR